MTMDHPVTHRIFMDYQSTTPVDRRVLDAMLPFFTDTYGNPHSTEHVFGREAHKAIADALGLIAGVIGVEADDLVLTSGATEANNLALRGVIPMRRKSHLISCVTEHESVLSTLSSLEESGCTATVLAVDANGLVDPDSVAASITPLTQVVSLMAVNGEVGAIQPIEEVGTICRERDVLFHVDAAQGFGRIAINPIRSHIDMLSISAHKIYGPKGIGALYVNARARAQMRPLMTGGGQQGGLRSGTVATPLAVGLGVAARLMAEEGSRDNAWVSQLARRLLEGLIERVGGVHVNGSVDRRYPGNLNLRLDGVDADSVLMMLPEIAMSTASACRSGTPEPSAVLMALGLSKEEASQSLRLGVGRMTTMEEVEQVIERLSWAMTALRA